MPFTQSFQTITEKGVRGQLFRALEASAQLSWVVPISMEVTSDQLTESYGFLQDVPAMREWIGGRVSKNLKEENFTITNRKYESTMRLPLDDIRRDKTGQVDIRVREQAQRAISHWASLLSTLINTNGNAYDGVTYFNADHTIQESGTNINDVTDTQISFLNVATAASPTALEMVDIILGLVGHFKTFNDVEGEPIHEDASQFLLMLPTIPMWNAAKKAINQNFLNAGETNILAIDPDFTVKPVLNTRLSANTTNMWFFRTDVVAKPFIRQQEGPFNIKIKGAGSDFEFDNDAWEFGLDTNRNVGNGRFENAIRATTN